MLVLQACFGYNRDKQTVAMVVDNGIGSCKVYSKRNRFDERNIKTIQFC